MRVNVSEKNSIFMNIVIATSNGYKIRETKALLKAFSFLEVFSLLDFPQFTPPQEKGKSIKEIAVSKATHAAKSLNSWVLADQSALVVPALSGQPGINSSHFAAVGAPDKENRKKLLTLLKELSHPTDRFAYFECVVALASPSAIIKTTYGACEGFLTEEEKGSGGFGYDCLFSKHDYKLTFAQLSEDIKNSISHRAKALKKILPQIEALNKRLTTNSE